MNSDLPDGGGIEHIHATARALEDEELKPLREAVTKAEQILAEAMLRVHGQPNREPGLNVVGDNGRVTLDFGTLVRWVAFNPTDALNLARKIQKAAYLQKGK